MNHNNKNVSRIQTTHIKKQHLLVINVSGGAVHMPQQKPTIIPARHHQNSRVLTIISRSSKIKGYSGVITNGQK